MFERIKAAVSRFDVILVFILAFAVFLVCVNEWNIINGHEQLAANVWTFGGTITGGEIVAFSLYQISKKVMDAKAPATLKAKHGYVKDAEEEGK